MPRPKKVLERYYPQLREWAAVLTRGDRSRCEDIVHDLYLYVLLANPDFSRVENIENYLFQSLRHMYLSTLSRESREAAQAITVTDFDSIRVSLCAKPHRDAVQLQNDLRLICHYAVLRKAQHRSASYFIFKFFHGYRVQETAEIACVPIGAVERRLSEARAEVRAYLAQPSIRPQPPEPPQNWGLVPSQQLLKELRGLILASRTGDCLSQGELKSYYGSLNPRPVPTASLAHIVSCEDCLARIDRIYRRPTLKDREPLDGIDGADGDGNSVKGQSGPGSGHQALLRKVERLREDLYDQRPQTLSIAIDGKIVASHEVQAQRNVLSARVERVDESTYVEVLSEQGFRLALLWFDKLPPHGSHQRNQLTELSDGRWVDLTLTIDGQGLRAEVVYFSPEMAETTAAVRAEDENPPLPVLVEMKPLDAEGHRPDGQAFHQGRAATPEEQRDPSSRLEAVVTKLRSWFRGIPTPTMSPLFASAIVLGIASFFCFYVWTKSGPRISARTLIGRAEQSDVDNVKSARTEVIYQKVRITSIGHAMQRAIYRDPEGKRHLKRQQLSADEQRLKDQLGLAGVNWDEPLSAAAFREWRDHLPAKRDVVTRMGNSLLTLTTSADINGVVSRESLTVRESDFHPVDRTIELRNMGTVEIAEVNYAVLPWGAVNQDWFEPLAGAVVSDVPAIRSAIHLPHVLSDLELDEAELAARSVLNQLHADTGESIHLTRSATGIDVKGVVETDGRKQDLLSHLALLPNVRSSILSEEEIAARPPSQSIFDSGQPIEVHSLEAQSSPLEQYLREKKLPEDQLTTVSHDLLYESLSIDQAGVHYSELRPRSENARQLPVDLQNQLSALSDSYLATIQTGIDKNRHTLLSLGFDSPSQAATPELSEPDRGIDEEIRRYRQLCLELISNGMGRLRPAPTIAEELMNTDERIRLHLAKLSVTVPEHLD